MNNSNYESNSGSYSTLREINEALQIGNELIFDIDSAIKNLSSAQNWATFDMFTKKGLISHFLKYNNIDKAKETMNLINTKVMRFEKELRDVKMNLNYSANDYSGGLMAIDYFFDNIFTDFHVRNKIKEDKNSLLQLKNNVNEIMYDLRRYKADIENGRG